MKPSARWPLSLLALAALLAACSKPAEAPPAASPAGAPASAAQAQASAGIDWQQAASDADVDAAFARAVAERKPLFVYWGAKWCPPCNQVQATLFNRVDFIERSRAFVPVYIDGDSPGAQKLGARFKVRGYPTLLLFTPDGRELTRLPGEVDAQQMTQVLTLGMNAQRPVKAVLADARAGAQMLSANDWRLLAFYSWETDEQQIVPKAELPALLQQLAAACPADQAETATRLMLKAAALTDAKATPRANAALRGRALAVLSDAPAARAQMDVLTNYAADIVRALSTAKSPERAALVGAFDAALTRLQADATLSRADRLTALEARVDLVKIDTAKAVLPDTLLAEVREQAARNDREITDGYERQAVITSAAYLLEQAGLVAESDALLKANLAKSHSPYYLMSQLSSNAKRRGDKADALHWSQQAFDSAEGPATRLQWGASYVGTLVELAPKDEARIERAAQQLFNEAAAQPNAFYERSARSLQRAADKLQAWNQGKAHSAVLQRLRLQLGSVCARLPADDAQRAVCEGLFKPAARSRRSA
ncbi:thioredoxin family protein [Piscinibacter sp.]|jgi:thioredoxin-related protein|uniref:thioredoxin family protein n=1 Tax=Piscinibacter sp. TaxID=1903157 RepID=UPI003559546B